MKSPILGWDFIRKYKLDWIWGEFGDLYLRDRRAAIAKRLDHVSINHGALPRVESVTEVLSQVDEVRKWNKFSTQCFEILCDKSEKKEVHEEAYAKLLKNIQKS